jgi:hypothetical protein
MRGHIFKSKPSGANIAAVAIGATAIAGLTVMFAMPKVRKTCARWLDDMVGGLKKKTSGRTDQFSGKNGGTLNWEMDRDRAEELKGPLETRKDPAVIKVASAGTTAWRDDWSSE